MPFSAPVILKGFGPMKVVVSAANDIKYMTGGFHYFPAVLLQCFKITLRNVSEVTWELINGQYYSSGAANISRLFMLEGDASEQKSDSSFSHRNSLLFTTFKSPYNDHINYAALSPVLLLESTIYMLGFGGGRRKLKILQSN